MASQPVNAASFRLNCAVKNLSATGFTANGADLNLDNRDATFQRNWESGKQAASSDAGSILLAAGGIRGQAVAVLVSSALSIIGTWIILKTRTGNAISGILVGF